MKSFAFDLNYCCFPDDQAFQLKNKIHVWKLDMSLFLSHAFFYELHLSDEEQSRAHACQCLALRQRFVLTRFVLRELLSRYLSQSPATISLCYAENGKPELTDSDLRFNLSHSGSTLLLVFCQGRRIGIDIERIKPRRKLFRLAQRCLATTEHVFFEGLPFEARLDYFYQRWTLKEALLKAWGVGLRTPMKSIEIMGSVVESRFVEYWAESGLFSCQLQLLPRVQSDSLSALAVEGEALPLSYWDAGFLLEKKISREIL